LPKKKKKKKKICMVLTMCTYILDAGNIVMSKTDLNPALVALRENDKQDKLIKTYEDKH
jgi:hypothetical protein